MSRMDDFAAAAPQKAPSDDSQQTVGQENFQGNLKKKVEVRYQNAYRKARFIIGVGKTINIIGAIIGILIGISGFLIDSSMFSSPYGRQSDAGLLAGFVMLVFGGCVWFAFFIASVIVSAKGQELLASLDSAVYSSPFIDLPAKARAMFLE